MKVKLDENIPLRVKTLLEEKGHEVDTVAGEGMVGFEDDVVWSGFVLRSVSLSRRILIFLT